MSLFAKNHLIPVSVVFLLTLFSCGRAPFVMTDPQFAGSRSCMDCHQKEYDLWVGSDHDNAMDTATDRTVLGDFNNAFFTHNGFTTRFYTREGKYYVYTEGPGGVPDEFQVAYTFGVRPLQQYLIPFGKGRLQCLQIAWDTERKQWYHLADSVYQGQKIHPDDWLYWTNNGQNWNGMCAECHSTNLRKNYNPVSHEYHTTWSEIDVSCEACHGPGSEHNRWAAIEEDVRPQADNAALPVMTSNISSQKLVEQCAYCHARRSSFEDLIYPRDQVLDIMSPQLPVDPYYYHDGQIKEEDYVYGSFTQSKMHQNSVRCTYCHDPHSLNLKFDGNRLCYQCHNQEKYGGYTHHFHKLPGETGEPLILEGGTKVVEVGSGSLCVECHMPGKHFMGVDFRRDHSMRIPRPDLSDYMGTPNACTGCHTDKTNAWAAGFTSEWYGESRPFHFGPVIFRAFQGDTTIVDDLVRLIDDPNTAGAVRATGVYYLGSFQGTANNDRIRERLQDPSPLVRRESVRAFTPDDINDLKISLIPLLTDSVRMVRMETAYKLSAVPLTQFDSTNQSLLKEAISEYIKAMEYSADFAASRHNLGNIYSNLGQYEKAMENYLEATRIDGLFYPAKINLAMTYNKVGKNEEALALLEQVTSAVDTLGEVWYSKGLLQAEMGMYEASIESLKKATLLLPGRARIWYNLFRLYEFTGDTNDARKCLVNCLALEPRNLDFLGAEIQFLMGQGLEAEAKEVAKKILDYYPDLEDRETVERFINGTK